MWRAKTPSERAFDADATALLVDVAQSGCVQHVEWPAEKKPIDIGSFYADSSKFTRTTGWVPTVSLRDGLERTVSFYRQHYRHYVDAPQSPEPKC